MTLLKNMEATEQIKAITKNSYLKTAENIGKQFVRDAIWSPEGYCNWQGASLEVLKGEYTVLQRTFDASLYSGLSGIALFLGELVAKTDNPLFEKVLMGTVNNILNQHKNNPLPSHFSFFGGQLGVAYMLWRLGNRLNNQKWKKKGLYLLSNLKDKPINDAEIDVIAGAAGAIPILVGIFQAEKKPELLEAAVKCGDFLLKKAHQKGQTSFWQSIGANNGLTGYSHGNAGISGALMDLAIATGNQQYRAIALQGYEFEKQHYKPQHKNWPDLRVQPGQAATAEPHCCEMWCHGAPGMVLSRIKAYQQTNDARLWEDAKNALDTTYNSVSKELQNPLSSNFSLCHGLAGNADILISAGTILNNPACIQLAEQVGQLGIKLYDETATDWPSGVNDPSGKTSGRAPSPGLMLGLAGTGYFYLRLADNTIPSMLLL